MPRIVVVGSLNMDVVASAPRIPAAGETIIGGRLLTAPGGKGANQAYAAAKLGGEVAMIGRVGEDDFGKRLRENLESSGCDVSCVKATAGASGAAVIYLADTGQNSIVVIPGANDCLEPDDLQTQMEAEWIANASVVLLQLETPLATVEAAARISAKPGSTRRTVLDPAPAPSNPLPRSLLASIDILTPNESEACLLAGRTPTDLTREDAGQLVRRLLDLGAKAVVMKLGAQGCLLLSDAEEAFVPAPRIKAVDTTAAGDVFNGALAVALSEGGSLTDACRFATLAAALKVTRPGTQAAAPTRREVNEFARELT